MNGNGRGTSQLEILSRIFKPDQDYLTAEAARAVLQLTIDPEDRARMHELAVKNQDGLLTPQEQEELENYRRVGRFLDLLASKARRSLRRLGQDA